MIELDPTTGFLKLPRRSDEEEALRERLGRLVREAWVAWAQTQPNPKPSWLVSYDELSEADKEADRRIGTVIHGIGFSEGMKYQFEGRQGSMRSAAPITPIRSGGYVGPSENEMRNGIMPKPGDTLYEEAPTTPTSPNEGAP